MAFNSNAVIERVNEASFESGLIRTKLFENVGLPS